MTIQTDTIYAVRLASGVAVNSFSATALGDEAAKAAARACRDAYNVSEAGKANPVSIVRGQRRRRVNHL